MLFECMYVCKCMYTKKNLEYNNQILIFFKDLSKTSNVISASFLVMHIGGAILNTFWLEKDF